MGHIKPYYSENSTLILFIAISKKNKLFSEKVKSDSRDFPCLFKKETGLKIFHFFPFFFFMNNEGKSNI